MGTMRTTLYAWAMDHPEAVALDRTPHMGTIELRVGDNVVEVTTTSAAFLRAIAAAATESAVALEAQSELPLMAG